jgi:hypothetical protein
MYVHPKTRLIKKRILARTLASIEEEKRNLPRNGWQSWGQPRTKSKYKKVWVQLNENERIPDFLYYFGSNSYYTFRGLYRKDLEQFPFLLKRMGNYDFKHHGYWKNEYVGEVVHPFDEARTFRREYNYHKNYVRYPKYYNKWDYRDMRYVKRKLIEKAEHQFALEDYYSLPE